MKLICWNFVRRIRCLIALLLPLLFFYTLSAYADDDEIKPYTQLLNDVFRTELVYPQEKGEVQISLLPTLLNERDQKNVLFPLEFEYGLTDAWQFNLFAESFILHFANNEPRTTGIGDIGVGTKYSFMKINQSDYSASLNLDITIPTGDINKDLTEGFMVYEPSISFAKDFPHFYQSQLFGQIGFEFLHRVKKPKKNEPEENESEDEEVVFVDDTEIEPQAHRFFLNIGYFIPYGIARYVIEMNWENNRWNHHGEENEIYITPGIVLVPSKHWEFKLGASIGLNHTSDPYDLFLGASYEF